MGDWKPLPQRRKFAKAVEEPAKRVRVAVSTEARTEQGLSAQDGCAGEFYEYLDHTADVQCHAWGKDLSTAYANMALCMCNYMTDLARIYVDPEETLTFSAKGHDLESLLFKYLDEILYKFCTDSFCPKVVEVTSLNLENFEIQVTMQGCIFNPEIHGQGTEIKAITYSNMQIHQTHDRVDLYVIVDI